MYKDFYHMKIEPFGTLPSPDIYFASETHQGAWDYLVEGLESDEPSLLVTGAHGTGKSLLSLRLVKELTQQNSLPFVYNPVPNCDYRLILKDVARRLDITVPSDDEALIQYAIYKYFLESASRTSCYLIFDAVQDLDASTLVKIFNFTNFNHNAFFPFRLVLFGQPAVLEMLMSLHRDTINYYQYRHYFLTPLGKNETKEYIYYRLLTADAPGIPVFTDEAVQKIYSCSRGIPLLVNSICAACLRLGAAQELKIIDGTIVTRASGQDREINRTPQKTDFTEKMRGGVSTAAEEPVVPETKVSAEKDTTAHAVPALSSTRLSAALLIIIIVAALCASLLMRRDIATVFKGSQEKTATKEFGASSKTTSTSNHASIQKAEKNPVTIPAQQTREAAGEKAPAGSAPAELKPAASDKPAMSTVPMKAAVTASFNTSSIKTVTSTAAAGEKAPAGSAPAELKPAASDKPAMSTVPMKAAVTASFNTSSLKTITVTAVETRTAKYPYALQLACYNSEEVAREETLPFKRLGLVPFIVKSFSQRTGETLWVIYTGYYETAEKAERDKQKYQLRDAIAARTPYAVLIGTFAAAEEMSATVRYLEQLGYYPYAIPDGLNTLSLFAGAFSTRSGAEKLQLQLQADGIKSQVVLR